MYNADGAGFDKSAELMRIINDQHFARVSRLLQDARDKGATFAIGGETRAEDRFVAPTVLTKVTEDMLVMQEEIFAPVLPVIPFRDRSEAFADHRAAAPSRSRSISTPRSARRSTTSWPTPPPAARW